MRYLLEPLSGSFKILIILSIRGNGIILHGCWNSLATANTRILHVEIYDKYCQKYINIYAKICSLYICFLESFNLSRWMLNFVKSFFFTSIDMIIWFLFFDLAKMAYHISWLVDTEPFLNRWAKSHWLWCMNTFFVCVLLGPHSWHMEVPRPEVQAEL